MGVLALAGGVGGSRLADGLYRALPPHQLSVVVNTADDFWFQGLRVCPDLDTVRYALANLSDPIQGWGIAADSFAAMEMLERLGEPGWFRLGDRDLGLCVLRTRWLSEGVSATEVEARLGSALELTARCLPMCEHPVATRVRTPEGWLAFQDYFVRRRQQDRVLELEFAGLEQAELSPQVAAAFDECRAIILCPSNPLVSLAPILGVPGLRARLTAAPQPRLAVSPIIAGRAVKGPAAAMLESLGHESSALGVARLYQGLLDVMVIDHQDAALASSIEALGIRVALTDTLMRDREDRVRLARAVLAEVER